MKINNWKKIFWGVLFALQITIEIISTTAHAAGEYDFNWLDPDKKVYVLQNRRYTKADAVEFSLMGSTSLSDTYRTSYQVQPRLSYWFNEDVGLEAFYAYGFNSTNTTYDALIQAVGTGVSPLIRETKGMWGLLFEWAPWYAKINVFNTILYFDWYFAAGAGELLTQIGERTQSDAPATWTNQNLFTAYLGTGHIFHVSDLVKFRLEFMGHFYDADTYGGAPAAPPGKSWFSSYAISLGVGFKL